MTRNIRLALTVLTIGFAVEAGGAIYSWLSQSTRLPLGGWLLYFFPIFTAVGVLLLLVGRHEWNEVHRRRVAHAGRVFLLGLAAVGAAGAAVAYFVVVAPQAAQPAVLAPFVAVAVALFFASSYVTYAIAVAHLLRPLNWIVLGLALVWSAYVAYLLAVAVDTHFAADITALRQHSVPLSGLATPITATLSTMFVTYLLLLVAYADAHHRVAKGLDPPKEPA